jgi:hypothetical protein
MEKSSAWVIRSLEIVEHKVVFDTAVTAEEAEAMFLEDDFDDVLDSNTIHTKSASAVETFG